MSLEVPRLGVESELQVPAYTKSHSNMGLEPNLQATSQLTATLDPHLQATSQLTATLDPQPTKQGQGSNPNPHGY